MGPVMSQARHWLHPPSVNGISLQCIIVCELHTDVVTANEKPSCPVYLAAASGAGTNTHGSDLIFQMVFFPDNMCQQMETQAKQLYLYCTIQHRAAFEKHCNAV